MESFYDTIKDLDWEEIRDSIYSKTRLDVEKALNAKILQLKTLKLWYLPLLRII